MFRKSDILIVIDLKPILNNMFKHLELMCTILMFHFKWDCFLKNITKNFSSVNIIWHIMYKWYIFQNEQLFGSTLLKGFRIHLNTQYIEGNCSIVSSALFEKVKKNFLEKIRVFQFFQILKFYSQIWRSEFCFLGFSSNLRGALKCRSTIDKPFGTWLRNCMF